MGNAKKEFLDKVGKETLICAKIKIRENEMCLLPEEFSQEELDEFLQKIDVEYDSGYGGQELYGLILCAGGVWFDRFEYDGSESWERHEYPSMEQFERFKGDY